MAIGLGNGRYKLGVKDTVLIDGDEKITDLTTRAGSTLTTNRVLRR